MTSSPPPVGAVEKDSPPSRLPHQIRPEVKKRALAEQLQTHLDSALSVTESKQGAAAEASLCTYAGLGKQPIGENEA